MEFWKITKKINDLIKMELWIDAKRECDLLKSYVNEIEGRSEVYSSLSKYVNSKISNSRDFTIEEYRPIANKCGLSLYLTDSGS